MELMKNSTLKLIQMIEKYPKWEHPILEYRNKRNGG